ncbi:MAG: hypothetical protein HW421_1363 [Ignavibacteria bacterium]|nr:hypothetical protein [Ignavibacteria bacterium]
MKKLFLSAIIAFTFATLSLDGKLPSFQRPNPIVYRINALPDYRLRKRPMKRFSLDMDFA